MLHNGVKMISLLKATQKKFVYFYLYFFTSFCGNSYYFFKIKIYKYTMFFIYL